MLPAHLTRTKGAVSNGEGVGRVSGVGEVQRGVDNAPNELEVWRSCTGWRYPADDDSYMVKLANIPISTAGNITFTAARDCYYTLTTVTGRSKPKVPTAGTTSARQVAIPC
jgi:hypothetical protein